MRFKIALLAAALAACSTAAPSTSNTSAVLTRGEVVERLGAGQVQSLPTGTVYVRFVRFMQPPGYVINSKQHVPSLLYVETGVQRLILAGQSPIDLAAGQAVFHQSVTHQHLNPGSDTSTWYSIAVWPSSARNQPLVDRIASAAFESQDVDRAALPEVAYTEVLRRVALAGGGSSGAHRFGGLIAFYVLGGSIAIKSAHQAVVMLSPGHGLALSPDTDVQETNTGTDAATYLEFVVTPVGKDFEAPLQQPPAS